MLRPEDVPLQFDRPLFVRIPFNSGGRQLEVGQEFKWKELSLDEYKVMVLYKQRMIHHNGEMEKTAKVGDGLEELDIEGLHTLVASINEKVKLKTKTKVEFDKKRCKSSKIPDKQRGMIRQWRRNYGHLETE